MASDGIEILARPRRQPKGFDFPQTDFASSGGFLMKKRSFSLIAALSLFASLAFATPSQAGGSVPFTVTNVTGGGTITSTHFIGATVSHAPSMTFTDVKASGTQTALPATPSFTQGATTSFEVASYTLSHLPISNSLYQFDGSLTQSITIQTAHGTGTFTISETVNALVGSYMGYVNQGPIAPQVVGTSTTTIGGTEFAVYYTATATVNSKAQVFIALEAVPEPASMSLLGIGMASFFAFRRFFNKKTVTV
jgi:hypothetical protein